MPKKRDEPSASAPSVPPPFLDALVFLQVCMQYDSSVNLICIENYHYFGVVVWYGLAKLMSDRMCATVRFRVG